MTDSLVMLCPVNEVVTPKVYQSSMALVGNSVKHGIDIHHIGVSERELIEGARNSMAEAFLQTKCEWSFWLDSDMLVPPDTIVELLRVAKEKNAKIATGIYYQRKGKNYPVLWSRDVPLEGGGVAGDSERAKTNIYVGSFTVPGEKCKEPFKVHAAGFGCILVHRNVFETLPKPWFKFVYATCSEDFYFLVNAKNAGFETWAVPSLRIGHMGDAKFVYKEDCYRQLNEGNIEVETLKFDSEVSK
jgi:GT2 family glycosyltransferase